MEWWAKYWGEVLNLWWFHFLQATPTEALTTLTNSIVKSNIFFVSLFFTIDLHKLYQLYHHKALGSNLIHPTYRRLLAVVIEDIPPNLPQEEATCWIGDLIHCDTRCWGKMAYPQHLPNESAIWTSIGSQKFNHSRCFVSLLLFIFVGSQTYREVDSAIYSGSPCHPVRRSQRVGVNTIFSRWRKYSLFLPLSLYIYVGYICIAGNMRLMTSLQ